MYKITLLFESGEKGIYTREEETASDEKWKNMKVKRLLERWYSYFVEYPTLDYISSPDFDEEYLLFLLNKKVDTLNQNDSGNRKLTFQVEKLIVN